MTECAHLRDTIEADAAARCPLIVIDVLTLQNSVDREAVQSQLHAASGVGARAVELYAPPLLHVRQQPVVVVFPTCVCGCDGE